MVWRAFAQDLCTFNEAEAACTQVFEENQDKLIQLSDLSSRITSDPTCLESTEPVLSVGCEGNEVTEWSGEYTYAQDVLLIENAYIRYPEKVCVCYKKAGIDEYACSKPFFLMTY